MCDMVLCGVVMVCVVFGVVDVNVNVCVCVWDDGVGD